MSTPVSSVGDRVAGSYGQFVAVLGVASVAVGFGGVLLAMVLSAWFSPFLHALSDLGIAGYGTAWLFNGSLMLGGALGAGFAVALADVVDHPIRLAALVVLFFALVFMALVGVFPLPSPFHGAVAIAFFGLLTFGLFLWGAGDYAAGRTGRGLLFVVAAIVHVVVWAWWFTFPWLPPGIAIPELVGSVGLSAWALWLSADVYRARGSDGAI